MRRFLHASNWISGLLLLIMPLTLIYALGSQMAYGQVQRRYESYVAMPEFTRLAELQSVPPGEKVLLRGQIAPLEEMAPPAVDPNRPATENLLLIYQERPLDGREVRYREEFPLVAPAFKMTFPDGMLIASTTEESEKIISHEAHRLVLGDRELTGFQAGDTITVQGQWQPVNGLAKETPLLLDATGFTGVGKETLLAEVQAGMAQVRLVRNGLALLALVSVLLLALQFYRSQKGKSPEPPDLLGSGTNKNERLSTA